MAEYIVFLEHRQRFCYNDHKEKRDMSSLNKVMLIGRLGRDPELRYTQAGKAVCNFSMATDESYKDRDGNKVDKAEWHDVVAWDRTGENCANYLRKGSMVYVEGRLQTRKWQDQQGNNRRSTEIVAERVQFLDTKPQQGEGQTEQRQQPRQQPQGSAPRQQRPPSHQEDDLGPAWPSSTSDMGDVPF